MVYLKDGGSLYIHALYMYLEPKLKVGLGLDVVVGDVNLCHQLYI